VRSPLSTYAAVLHWPVVSLDRQFIYPAATQPMSSRLAWTVFIDVRQDLER
jgi:hypothetical protein